MGLIRNISRKIGWLFIIAAIFMPTTTMAGKIYVHTDANGVQHFTDRPRNSKFKLFWQFLDDPTSKINRAIRETSSQFGLSEHLVRAVVRVESAFDPEAVSSAGARGLMQLMPQTAKELQVADPHDISQSIWGGVKYLRKMIDRFGTTKLGLAAYNAGPTNVIRYNGIPPFEETQRYVQKVLDWRDKYATKAITR